MDFSINRWGAVSMIAVAGIIMGTAKEVAEYREDLRDSDELPIVGQAWNMSGRGVVVIDEMDLENNRIRFVPKNSDNSWLPKHGIWTDLDRFLNYAKVEKHQSLTVTLPKEKEKRPVLHQKWEMEGVGTVMVSKLHLDTDPKRVEYKIEETGVFITENLDIFLYYADVRKDPAE